jgi:protein SCO1/2
MIKGGSRALQIVVWSLLSLVILGVIASFLNSSARRSDLKEYGKIQPFSLTNQLGETITLSNLKGQVWVADVIFTRCAGPCPKMTDQMAQIQQAFPAAANLRFVSLTTDPEHDTSSRLKDYSEKFSADPARWHFLTGPKKELLANLAVGSLKLSALEKDKELQLDPNDLFIHSTVFVLVDKTGEIRGFYESLEEGFQEKIQADIKSLLAESE